MTSFQYSLNSSTIKTTPVLQKIAVAAKAGYTGIELWHDDIDAYVEAGGSIQDIRKCVDDNGLKVPTTIHMKDWFQPAGSEHAAAMDIAKHKLEQAAAVGAAFTVSGPPHGKADRALGKRHYHELLQLGVQFGVRPAFEYLGFVEDIRTIDDAIEIAVGSAHPNASIVLDPFHCYVGLGGMESIAKLSPDQIAISHFNDAPPEPAPQTQRDPDRVMPGDGAIDLKRYCDLLRQVEYSGFLSLELFRPEFWELDPLEVATLGLEKMRAAAEA
jgi:sugar phosphate isomerase/epimerase